MNEESNVYARITTDGTETNENIGTEYEENAKFRVSNSSNLPAKTTFFSRLKSVLFTEIRVELTPYEQKIEDEINEFLHQEITWQSFKNFLFQEVEVTHRGKRIL